MNNKITVDHNAGFFSCCTVRLQRIVEFYNDNKIFPIVDSSNQWSFYKDHPVDITNVFFKNIDEEVHIENKINHTLDHELSPYYELDFENIKIIIDKYFQTSDYVNDVFNNLISNYNLDLDKVIAVCYRGNDKQKETNIPSHYEMINKISDLRSKFPDHKLLIQSDEVDFYESVMNVFPDFIYFKEVSKIRKNENMAVQYSILPGQRTEQAVIFLAIMKILSRSSNIIINSGNVGMWISLFRGNIDNTYQYLNHKEYIYGVKNKFYGRFDKNWFEKI
jgi:hypothetical protein